MPSNNSKDFYRYDPYELQVGDYEKDADITIINAAYQPLEKYDDGSMFPDYIQILYRDNITGEKHVETIMNPLYTFYVLKEEYITPGYNPAFEDKDKLYPVTCKYTNILRTIAEETGYKDFYSDNIREGQYSANKALHTDTHRVFLSDMNIENYYRFLFNNKYKNNIFKLSKAYLDIETDGRFSVGDFPEPGEVPINAVAFCDEAHNVTYQFLLDDPNNKNPSLNEYKKKFTRMDMISKLKKFVIDAVGGPKKAAKFGVDKMEYKIIFYQEEINLLKDVFNVINASRPDFIMIWNMAFDLNFIIARLENLGADPSEIICDPTIEPKNLLFYVDQKNKNNYEERGDFVRMSTYSVWLDQMIQFASRRKGRGRYQSFKLDAIGEVVAGVRKLDYSHITKDINALPYMNYETFSFYNVMDVIVQKCIETMTQDCEYVFNKCLQNNTSYAKCHRQSVYLANRFAKEYYSNGYIIGNNRNSRNEKPSTKFPGAMVGDPTHNDPDITVHINGKPSLIVDNGVDFDYSSLYPSIIRENNIANNTQLGRVIIEDPNNPDAVFSKYEHPDMFSNTDEFAKYSRGGEFLENLMCGNTLEFAYRWLNLGTVYDVMDDIKEYYSTNNYIGRAIDSNMKDAIYYVKNKMQDAIIELEDFYRERSAIYYINATPTDEVKEELKEEIRKGALL